MKEPEHAADVREKDVGLSSSLETTDDTRVGFEDPFSQAVDVVHEIEIALRLGKQGSISTLAFDERQAKTDREKTRRETV